MNVLDLQDKFGYLLYPIALLYAEAMRLRRRFIKSYSPPIPTISVGNIAWGGTGKTPITDFILKICENHKLHACVLTRGYGGKPNSLPYLVNSDKSTPDLCGDEPLMLASKHKDACIIVDPKRVRAAKFALSLPSFPDIFLLDDGFQHLPMGRSLNLVLLRPNDIGKQYNNVIPSGQWREGASALAYADAFLMKIDSMDSLDALKDNIKLRLEKFNKPFFAFTLNTKKPKAVIYDSQNNLNAYLDDGISAIEYLCAKGYILASGVGNPQSVYSSAEKLLGIPPKKHLVYNDHHQYTQQDADNLSAENLPILCTEKDSVKLRQFRIPNLWELPVVPDFISYLWSNVDFESWILPYLKATTPIIRENNHTQPSEN